MANGKLNYFNKEFNCYEYDGIYYVLNEPVDSKEEMLEFLEELKDKNSGFNKYMEEVGAINIIGTEAYYRQQIEYDDYEYENEDDDDYEYENEEEPDWGEYLEEEGYLDEDQMPDYD